MAGLFGKTPSHRDFVRVNIGSPQVLAFDEWLRTSVMTLPSLCAHLSPEPLAFVFRAPDQDSCLIGVMRRSEDGVGREFPLAVFQPIEGRPRAWSALPRAYVGFIHAATELLAHADALTFDEIGGRLEQLPRPGEAELEASLARAHAQLAELSADELLDRLFSRPTGNPEGERWVDDHLYGLGMFVRACQRTTKQPAPSAAITLDCPISGELELMFWLELARLSLAWTAPPSLLWSRQQQRLLLALGRPGPSLLGVLGTPGTIDAEIWPVLTDEPSVAAAGGQLLTPAQRAAIARAGQSALELLSGLAPQP